MDRVFELYTENNWVNEGTLKRNLDSTQNNLALIISDSEVSRRQLKMQIRRGRKRR